MFEKINMKSVSKWIPVVIAAMIAAIQQVCEQKEAERIDEMEERIAKLEADKEDA